MIEIFYQANIEHADAYDQAAKNTHQVGIDADQRHHQNQGQHTRHYEEFHWRYPESFQCIDLFVDLHGSQLSGKGRTGAPRHYNSGHDSPQNTDHGDTDQIGDIDLGTEHF